MPRNWWDEDEVVQPVARRSTRPAAPATRTRTPSPTSADSWWAEDEEVSGGGAEGELFPSAAQPPAKKEEEAPGPVSRFIGNWWEQVNPVAIVKGLANVAMHPRDTIDKARESSQALFEKALGDHPEETVKGMQRVVEAPFTFPLQALRGTTPSAEDFERTGQMAAGALPFIGPTAAQAGEQIGAGDVAGGLGKGTGMLTLVAADLPKASKAVGRMADAVGLGESAAKSLEGGAAGIVEGAMNVRGGRNATRLNNDAARVAPKIARELAEQGAPLTHEGFRTQIEAGLTGAKKMLDEAEAARLSTRTFSVKDILADLQKARDALTAKAVGRGKDVVPGPRMPEVRQIDKAMKEIKQLRGPMVTYEAIRRIRDAYDIPAEITYHPSMTGDFLKNQGGASGAATVAGTLRDYLAKWDPQTATANAHYSMYKSASDVMRAVGEVNKSRPQFGRQIMTRLATTGIGAVLGEGAGHGIAGAAVGMAAGPMLDAAMSAGPTLAFKRAALYQNLAVAIRKGNIGQVNSITHQLQRLRLPVTSQAGRGESPAKPVAPASIPDDLNFDLLFPATAQ